MTTTAPRSVSHQPAVPMRPDGPGRIGPGQRVTCLPGSLPARDGGRGGGVLVFIGPKTSVVDVYGGTRRRIPNELLHPEAGPHVAADRDARGLRTANADGRGWLPAWSWLGWTIAEHVEYQQGVRQLPTPPPAPQRLIIVACGSRKANCFEAPAGQMYIGSYHRAARRAADAVSAPGDRVMILSARYGLLDLTDRILRYETRMRSRWAITVEGLREQAEQLGVLETTEVVVLAPAAYANLAAQVWPHARLALAGTRGIGDQMARFAALATARTTIADIVPAARGATTPETAPARTGDLHAVSVHGGKVHLAGTTAGSTDTPAPACGAAGRRGSRWRLTTAEVTCTRCTAIMLRRRALRRWCAMVDRAARAVSGTPGHSPPAARRPGSSSEGQIGPAPRRPATRRRGTRWRAGRRPGDARRCRDPRRWQHAPARPYPATPLTWTVEPAPRRSARARHRCPRGPRPSIGRAPPPVGGAWRWPDRPPAQPTAGADPLTPVMPLTRENSATRSGSANGFAQPSRCTTRRTAAGHPLPEPLRPAPAPQRIPTSTNRTIHVAPEVQPMTDLTTRPTDHGTGPALAPVLEPVPVNGAALGDRRAVRHASRAEQERLSADAEVERRARAARLELELRERGRAAARRERQADQQEKRVRVEQRRARRAARHARLLAAAPRWADRALFILPILMPMAVAWVGQIRFAMTVMHWPLAAAVVFAAGFELSTAYAARLDWLARAAGDSGLLFRGATWGFAAGAALMNYWHAAGPDFAPTGEAVSYGLMSITGVVLWELLSTYRHRTALRAEGKLPAARPRYGLARWIWFRPLTRLASLLALRDGYPTTDLAWQAALAAVDLYGSPRAARKAVRAGRPVPRNVNASQDDGIQGDFAGDDDLRDVHARHTDPEITRRYLERDSQVRDNERDIDARHGDRDVTEQYVERDATMPGARRDTAAEIAAPASGTPGECDDLGHAAPIDPADAVELSTTLRDDLCDPSRDHGETTVTRTEVQGQDNGDNLPLTGGPADQDDTDKDAVAPTGNGDRPGELPSSSKGAVIARMRAYARACAAQGRSITGADLDRQFGTRDYGRKVLRQLAVETPGPPDQP